jgi:hypothetical protein
MKMIKIKNRQLVGMQDWIFLFYRRSDKIKATEEFHMMLSCDKDSSNTDRDIHSHKYLGDGSFYL